MRTRRQKTIEDRRSIAIQCHCRVNRSNDVSVIALQGLLDHGEAQTAAELSRGAAFVPRTWRSVRGFRLPGRSQVPVQEQTADRSTGRVDATARESRRHFAIVSIKAG